MVPEIERSRKVPELDEPEMPHCADDDAAVSSSSSNESESSESGAPWAEEEKPDIQKDELDLVPERPLAVTDKELEEDLELLVSS